MGSDGRQKRVLYRSFAAVRVLVSLAWFLMVCIWSDRAALFFSGALVMTHATMMALVVLATLATRLRHWPDALAAAESALLISIGVMDAAGLLGIVLYGVNIYGAGIRAADSPVDCTGPLPAGALAVTQLSCAMWVREPAIIILVLVLLGLTLLAHLATLIMVVVQLRRPAVVAAT